MQLDQRSPNPKQKLTLVSRFFLMNQNTLNDQCCIGWFTNKSLLWDGLFWWIKNTEHNQFTRWLLWGNSFSESKTCSTARVAWFPNKWLWASSFKWIKNPPVLAIFSENDSLKDKLPVWNHLKHRPVYNFSREERENEINVVTQMFSN